MGAYDDPNILDPDEVYASPYDAQESAPPGYYDATGGAATADTQGLPDVVASKYEANVPKSTPQNQPPVDSPKISKNEVPKVADTSDPWGGQGDTGTGDNGTPDDLAAWGAGGGQGGGWKSPAWDALAKKDAQINALRSAPYQGITGLFANNVRGRQDQIRQLMVERKELYQQAVYEDNRQGNMPVGKPTVSIDAQGNRVLVQSFKNGQTKVIGAAPPDSRVEAAKVHGQYLLKRQADIQAGKVTIGDDGIAYYPDESGVLRPVTKEQQVGLHGDLGEGAGEPTPIMGQVPFKPQQKAAKPGAIHYEHDPETGNILEFDETGALVRTVPGGKKKEPKEDPAETKARQDYTAVYGQYLKDHPDDFDGARRAARGAASAARQDFADIKAGKGGEALPPPGTGWKKGKDGWIKNYRNNKTGQLEPFLWDGSKPVPYVPGGGVQ